MRLIDRLRGVSEPERMDINGWSEMLNQFVFAGLGYGGVGGGIQQTLAGGRV